ncbi:hypothetical protein Hanom_Chr14g01320681 [Helianthus anomalus]
MQPTVSSPLIRVLKRTYPWSTRSGTSKPSSTAELDEPSPFPPVFLLLIVGFFFVRSPKSPVSHSTSLDSSLLAGVNFKSSASEGLTSQKLKESKGTFL